MNHGRPPAAELRDSMNGGLLEYGTVATSSPPWNPPASFMMFGAILSVISPVAAFVLVFQAAHDEPFMVWRPRDLATYVIPPLVLAILWAAWLGRLLVAHRPPRTAVTWALAIVWVVLNFCFLAAAAWGYLGDMWRMADNVYVYP